MSEPAKRTRGVSAREKRELVGDDWPNCECHGQPKFWAKRARLRAGGEFFCRVKAQERQRNYLKRNPAARASRNAKDRRYYWRDPEHARQRVLEWRLNNPEKARDLLSRRVFVGEIYVGTELQFPEGRKSVAPLIEAHLRFKANQAAERRSFTKELADESV